MIAETVETPVEVEVNRHRFTVAEFLRMGEVGVLAEDDAVELMWGEIVEMSPINVPHALAVNRLTKLLSARLGERAIVSVQNPIQLDKYSLPQPDLALWQLRPDEYHDSFPGPADVLLVIEVAYSSVLHDQKAKTLLYGAAGVMDYWVVNLPEQQIEVYREPRPKGYGAITYHTPGESLSPLAFPDVTLSVDEILGVRS